MMRRAVAYVGGCLTYFALGLAGGVVLVEALCLLCYGVPATF